MKNILTVFALITILFVQTVIQTHSNSLETQPNKNPESTSEQDQIRAFCIDFNWGAGGPNGFAQPGLWADANPVDHIDWYAALGVNVIQTFAVSCNGYAWYKGGSVVPSQPGLKHDFLPEMVKLGHAKNMRVIGYFCIAANTRWGLENPDKSYGVPSAFHIPLTTEYIDFLCDSIAEALAISKMDGFMIDWVWNPVQPNNEWLECEKQAYKELIGKNFPGENNIIDQELLIYHRKAIDRCWTRIRQTAKEANPDCIIWLSCYNMSDPTVTNSVMFQEVDWLMNEAGDIEGLESAHNAIGPHTRLISCLVGWGDKHNAKQILSDPKSKD